ncbi:MAG: YciI family protein [Phycisphaerales bacterium JB064]
MAKFMLMLFDNPADYADLSPDTMQQVVREYGEWAQSMAKAGKFVDGEKLADEGGKIIARKGQGVSVTDGPFAESKEVLGGFFIINAGSYEEAVEIASSSPHVKYGASTHVRQIDAT